VDRLAFSIMWDLDPSGAIQKQWVGRTIIRSCAKLAYGMAQDMIDGDFTGEGIAPDDGPVPLTNGCTWTEVRFLYPAFLRFALHL
jgi:DIS3-like exonuclease 2